MRTIEQWRAKNALERVRKLENRTTEFKNLYRSYVDRLGPAIVTNGLGQALATEMAAAGKSSSLSESAHHELYVGLEQWLCRNGGVYPPGSLLDSVVQHGQSKYVQAQAEALAWLEWHKKCCRATFPKRYGD